MNRLPSEYPLSEISPYQILGVQENDSLAQITATYRTMIKMLHPDRGLTIEARRLGWTDDEKNLAFIAVQDAYKTIVNERKYIDKQNNMPDYNLEYDIESDYTNHVQQKIDPRNFDQSAFNQLFEIERQRDIEQGFEDPYNRGYEMFSNVNTQEHDLIRKGQGRQDIPVSVNQKRVPHKMDNGALVKYNYLDDQNCIKTGSCPVMELGLTNINDFSVKIGSGSASLAGSDLMSVYGQDTEYWEDSVKKDQQLYNKYSDETRPEKKMNNHLSERDSFNFKEIDKEEFKK